MKTLFLWICVVIGCLAICPAANAVSDIDLSGVLGMDQAGQKSSLKSGDQMQGGGQSLSGMEPQIGSRMSGGSLSDSSLMNMIETRESGLENDDVKSLLGTKLTDEETDGSSDDKSSRTDEQLAKKKKERKSRTSSSKLVLMAEPDDGLVRLSWKLLNPPARTDEHLLRFIVRFGTESQLPIKTIQVGTGDGCVLRGLQNNQPYFVMYIILLFMIGFTNHIREKASLILFSYSIYFQVYSISYPVKKYIFLRI